MPVYRVKGFPSYDAYMGIDGMDGAVVRLLHPLLQTGPSYSGAAVFIKPGPSKAGRTFPTKQLPKVGDYIYFLSVELEELPDDQA